MAEEKALQWLLSTVHKSIVIGSGPAACTASIYLGRANLKPVMFEGNMAGGIAPGGQLTTTTEVENFPGFPDGIMGQELTERMRQQAAKCGTQVFTSTVARVDFSKRPFTMWLEEDEEFKQPIKSESVIIATGATARRLNIKNEQTYWQKGISACATCDGALPIFRNKPIGVIGGGDSACEEALHLTKFASKVYLIHRRNELRASKVMATRVTTHPKIEMVWDSGVEEAKGDGKRLGALLIRNFKTKKMHDIEVAGLFFAIGHKPNSEFVKGQIALDEEGFIVTKPGLGETNVPGVWAAGDVQDRRYRQAISAAGSGCQAALNCERWLEEHHN